MKPVRPETAIMIWTILLIVNINGLAANVILAIIFGNAWCVAGALWAALMCAFCLLMRHTAIEMKKLKE